MDRKDYFKTYNKTYYEKHKEIIKNNKFTKNNNNNNNKFIKLNNVINENLKKNISYEIVW
jgi:hypothetical protein